MKVGVFKKKETKETKPGRVMFSISLALMHFYFVFGHALLLHIEPSCLFIVVEVFWVDVFDILDATRQMQGSVSCLWDLWCVRSSGTSNLVLRDPVIHSALKLPWFGCVHATIRMDLSIAFCVVTSFCSSAHFYLCITSQTKQYT